MIPRHSEGSLKLYTAHKILMGTAAAGCLAYVAWAGVQLANTPNTQNGLVFGGSLAVTIGVVVYLRAFARRLKALQATPDQDS